MPIPDNLGFIEAASLPEVFFTAWNNVIWLGRLARGETLLVQGGTSGVGMAAIQLARRLRAARVFATAGSEEKRRVCREIGAEDAFDYRTQDWAAIIRDRTGGRGVDVVLDGQAGPYTAKQLDLLAEDGRVVLLASHLGASAEINVRDIVRRRLTLTGSVLRPRSPEYKGRIARELVEQVWPLLAQGTIAVRICATFPLEQAGEAHRMLDENRQIGKVVLRVDEKLLAAGRRRRRKTSSPDSLGGTRFIAGVDDLTGAALSLVSEYGCQPATPASV